MLWAEAVLEGGCLPPLLASRERLERPGGWHQQGYRPRPHETETPFLSAVARVEGRPVVLLPMCEYLLVPKKP